MKGRYTQVGDPDYFITGWYDNLLHEGFKCFAGWTTESGSPEERPQTPLDHPEDPVPTLGGQSMFIDVSGPEDRRPVERRDDVLVYTCPPLAVASPT